LKSGGIIQEKVHPSIPRIEMDRLFRCSMRQSYHEQDGVNQSAVKHEIMRFSSRLRKHIWKLF